MLRIAVVEDEDCQEQIARYLKRYAQERERHLEIRYFTDGDMIVEAYKPVYDIVLMDIQLPLLDGFSAAELIRKKDPEVIIIFITNMVQYAIKGYSVDALDYVVKPLSYFPFSQFMDRALNRLQRREARYISINIPRGFQKLNAADIYYVESQDHAITYYTRNGDYRFHGRMRDEEKRLEPYGFLRCHSSFLVNPIHVDGIQEGNIRIAGRLLPVSRSQKKAFFEALAANLNEGR